MPLRKLLQTYHVKAMSDKDGLVDYEKEIISGNTAVGQKLTHPAQ